MKPDLGKYVLYKTKKVVFLYFLLEHFFVVVVVAILEADSAFKN
jgi:hypothetical protein